MSTDVLKPQEGDVVISPAGGLSGSFHIGAYQHPAQILCTGSEHAVRTARVVAARFRADAWSTSDGRRFISVARNREPRHGLPHSF